MDFISIYYSKPSEYLSQRLTAGPKLPLASLVLGRTSVGLSVDGSSYEFKFVAAAHLSIGADDLYKPLNEPENDLFDERGVPLPGGAFKSVRGIVANEGANSCVAALHVGIARPKAVAALFHAHAVQKSPPAYCTANANCAMFAANVAIEAGVDLAAMAGKEKIGSPLDVVRSFQAASAMIISEREGTWVGKIDNMPMVLVGKDTGLFSRARPVFRAGYKGRACKS
jgi:hypothetical protein